MPRSSPAASLSTIARTLGVSTATVSNAFNRPERVAPATLARVLAEAERLGYAGPDPAARHLRRGRADAIGLLLTDQLPFAFEDHAAVGFLAGVAQVCEESGRSLVMLPSGSSTPTGLPPLGSVALDGLVVYSVADGDPVLAAAQARRLPVVVVDQPLADLAWDWVGIDDRRVGASAAAHLLSLGHRRLAVLTSRLSPDRRNGPVEPGAPVRYAVLRERLEGFFGVLAEHGLDRRDVALEERTQSAEAAGAAGVDAVLRRHPGVTALFCLTDELALGALARLRERGVDVPERLSVVGVDDIERAESSGLTTVAQPLAAKGAVAGRQLVARVEERLLTGTAGAGAVRLLPATLQVRSSTGPPRTG